MKILIVAALAAFGAADAFPAPSDAQFAQARETLNQTLLDYPSARFRDVHGDSRRLCGFVNSKNRMGAYTGWDRFVIMGLAGSEPAFENIDRIGRVQLLCDNEEPPIPSSTDYSDRLTYR